MRFVEQRRFKDVDNGALVRWQFENVGGSAVELVVGELKDCLFQAVKKFLVVTLRQIPAPFVVFEKGDYFDNTNFPKKEMKKT